MGGSSHIPRCSIIRINSLSHRESESEGGHGGPSGSGYRVHQDEVERCESLSISRRPLVNYPLTLNQLREKEGMRNPRFLRPGRDLNPGQKLRRLLGCPLPYRDTEKIIPNHPEKRRARSAPAGPAGNWGHPRSLRNGMQFLLLLQTGTY